MMLLPRMAQASTTAAAQQEIQQTGKPESPAPALRCGLVDALHLLDAAL
jgi:hypothetical protein